MWIRQHFFEACPYSISCARSWGTPFRRLFIANFLHPQKVKCKCKKLKRRQGHRFSSVQLLLLLSILHLLLLLFSFRLAFWSSRATQSGSSNNPTRGYCRCQSCRECKCKYVFVPQQQHQQHAPLLQTWSRIKAKT